MDEKKNQKKKVRIKIESTLISKRGIILISCIALVAFLTIFITKDKFFNQNQQPEIITESQLYKIVNVSELSTYQCVYNDICNVKDSTDKNETLYHVSYEAKVNAGIDFSNIKIKLENRSANEKTIKITIPQVGITDVNVDITSLDYMWEESDAETETVSEEAYRKCIEDVTKKANSEKQIYDLAQQNAENMIKALVKPFIEEVNSGDTKYNLEIESLTEEATK